MQKKNQYHDLVQEAKKLDINYLAHMNTVAEVADSSYDKMAASECRALGILITMALSLEEGVEDMGYEDKYTILQTYITDYVQARSDTLEQVMLARKTDTALLESAQLEPNQKH